MEANLESGHLQKAAIASTMAFDQVVEWYLPLKKVYSLIF